MKFSLDVMTLFVMLFAVVLMFVGIYIIAKRIIDNRKTNNVKRFVGSGQFMTAEAFIKYCDKSMSGKGGLGAKLGDGPGCYVIKAFSDPTKSPDEGNLYDIIIGTSEKMCDTVFRGLIGSGDQRLYDYYCRSKSMYIRFTRGEVGELAELEQKIREEFKDDLAKVEKKHISKSKKSKKRH